jgi:hypothetical protein
MKKLIHIFAVILVLIQLSCTSGKEKLDKLWFYTYSSGDSKNEDTALTPASFLNLQADKTYTLDFGGFDYGRWESNNGLLLLASSKGRTISFQIKHFFGNELSLSDDKRVVMNFEGGRYKFSSAAGNPFSAENNQWRIPATKKESEEKLKNRLRNHCKFYETYFMWALENDLNSVDVRSTPSLIKIYGNGFALKKFDELPVMWRSYFHDDEDCQKANDIIKNIFDHQDIAWAHTDNKYKMFLSAFQQLQRLVK